MFAQGSTIVLPCAAAALLASTGGICVAQSPALPTGALIGTVRNTSGEAISQVRVQVGADSLRLVLSDSSGMFRVAGIAPGLQRVHFRRLGFVPASFSLLIAADESVRVQVVLTSLPVPIAGVEIGAAWRPDLAQSGFYERLRQREQGVLSGTFITPEELENRKPLRTSYVLDGIPGLEMVRGRSGLRVVPHGRNVGRNMTRCIMAVFLDGMELSPETVASGELDLIVDARHVAAIEVYPSPSWSPERFQSTRINHPCGSIVIWTKSG